MESNKQNLSLLSCGGLIFTSTQSLQTVLGAHSCVLFLLLSFYSQAKYKAYIGHKELLMHFILGLFTCTSLRNVCSFSSLLHPT